MEVLTGDEYIALLVSRREEWRAENTRSPRAKAWAATPLLEWFIRPGDEALFNPPAQTPAPKKQTQPRKYRSAESLRAEQDALRAQADALTTPILNDRAAAGGVGLGARGTARVQQAEDRKLMRYAELLRRIRALDGRIANADARERKIA